jgi:1,5-anhydro-D-fructose reductase (1,5-anhydro-D-mannitol-forming)
MPIGWAIVSTGRHVDDWVAPAIVGAVDTQLVAVYSRDQARADALARKHGAQVADTSLEALVADTRVEAVFIAAQARKHVLVEKPMAVSVDEAIAMVRTCRVQGVKLGVGFHLRHHPGHHEARRLIGEGVLCTLTLVQAQMGSGIRGRTELPTEVFREARSRPRSEWWGQPAGGVRPGR